MVLMDRDYEILREVERWRVCLGRHIKSLVGFTGERACDRRLKMLIDAGYMERSHILYGVPGVYTLTHKAKVLLALNPKKERIKADTIVHDIAVLDTAIYMLCRYNISRSDILTEKELHMKDGFSNRKHNPDFIFNKDGLKHCVEVELSHKAKDRFIRNVKSNYMKYDRQIWVLPMSDKRNRMLLTKSGYTDIEIIDCEVIRDYIRNSK